MLRTADAHKFHQAATTWTASRRPPRAAFVSLISPHLTSTDLVPSEPSALRSVAAATANRVASRRTTALRPPQFSTTDRGALGVPRRDWDAMEWDGMGDANASFRHER